MVKSTEKSTLDSFVGQLLSLQYNENGQLLPFAEDNQIIHVLSYDEKPGIQAIATTSEDLPPNEKHKTIVVIMNISVLGLFHCLPG